jgi:hypothetical protein
MHALGAESVEQALAYFQGLPGVRFNDPESTTIGSASGEVIAGRADSNQIFATPADGQSVGWSAGTQTRVHVVDVDGSIVAIIVDSQQPVPPNFEARIQAILDSIVWHAES